MISIQEAGKEILTHSPRPFYVWVGPEYGIKEKYLAMLSECYSSTRDVDSVAEVLSLMKTKHMIPLEPCLYVVRYDDAFVASLSDKTGQKIQSTHIIGTIVCIYESDKQANKLEKYLPEFTVHIDSVDPRFVYKYLHSEFPTVCDRFLRFASTHATNYSHARNMTRCASCLDQKMLDESDDDTLSSLFATSIDFSEKQFQMHIACRHSSYLISNLEKYSNSLDNMLYSILRTMVEMEKALSTSYGQSDFREYNKYWRMEDVYNMFMITYHVLKVSRSQSVDIENLVVFLLSLLSFDKIPTIGELQWN